MAPTSEGELRRRVSYCRAMLRRNLTADPIRGATEVTNVRLLLLALDNPTDPEALRLALDVGAVARRAAVVVAAEFSLDAEKLLRPSEPAGIIEWQKAEYLARRNLDLALRNAARGCDQAVAHLSVPSVGPIDPQAGEAKQSGKDCHSNDATPRKRPRVTTREANLRAREALRGRPPGRAKRWSVRALARAIGCSAGLAAGLPAWQAYQGARRPADHGSGLPDAVSLTPAVLSGAGNLDADLERVIAEQQADWEDSPLVSHARKQRPRRRKL